jgi:hypothetical protein
MQKKSAVTMRAAGYTHTVISDKTGISISSLKRLFKEHEVKKGELKKKIIKKATDELIHDATTIETIKREAANLLLDDLAMVKRLRVAMAEAVDNLEATDTTEALQVMRAVSAGAVALKSTSETLRRSLGLDKDDDVTGELPELVITVMTNEEIEAVKQDAMARTLGIDDDLSGTLQDDLEVIVYDDTGKQEVINHDDSN